MIKYLKGLIIETECSEGNKRTISRDVSPRFSGWTYDQYKKEKWIKFLEPMTCHECTAEMLEEIDRDENNSVKGKEGKRKVSTSR